MEVLTSGRMEVGVLLMWVRGASSVCLSKSCNVVYEREEQKGYLIEEEVCKAWRESLG